MARKSDDKVQSGGCRFGVLVAVRGSTGISVITCEISMRSVKVVHIHN